MKPSLTQKRNASAKETFRVAWRRLLSRASPSSLDRSTLCSLLAILSPFDFHCSRLSTSSSIFASALGHCVRHQAVQAYRRHQQRSSGKDGKEPQIETLRGERSGQELLQRADV